MNLLNGIVGPVKAGLEKTATSFVTNTANKAVDGITSAVKSVGIGSFAKTSATGPSVKELEAEILRGGSPIDSKALVAEVAGFAQQSAEGAVSAGQMAQVNVSGARLSKHRVSLTEVGAGTDTRPVVLFDVMPEIVEQHTVEYEAIAPPQFPGTFQKYKGNAATQWTLNATFISRTAAEASRNYLYLMKLRGWTKPYFGARTGASFPEKLGAPPPVLMLKGLRDLIGPVPVVITALNWSWPRDVDYIATDPERLAGPDGAPVFGSDGKPIPFPVVLQVPIQLVESYSIQQFNEFSLADYRAGSMGKAFNAAQRAGDAGPATPTPPAAAAGGSISTSALPASSPPESSAAAIADLDARRSTLEAEAKKIDDDAVAFAMANSSTPEGRDATIDFMRKSAMQSELKKREARELAAKISSLRNT